MLESGIKAPDFELPDQNGEVHKLSDYLGKKIILYFYPKDNTPGCTKQACGFSERYPQFTEKGAVILGVSMLYRSIFSNLLKFCSAILSLHFQIVFSSSFDLLFIQLNISAVLSIKTGSSTGAMLSVSTIIFFAGDKIIFIMTVP